ncbi:MAG: restriction endonuclease subunit S, partial [Flavobacteriaceae bacterium]|nr:restriction endonuclease subunit S [Flavobacteriaceae bacterium]
RNLYWQNLKRIIISLPPLKEQQTIANYLDNKTTKINQAIEQSKHLITLLKEQKQALIQNAVTRGIENGELKMKNSGVSWLGEIPEHWEVKRLKHIVNGKLKYGANESGIEYQKDLPRYVRITDFGLNGKLSEENKLSLSWEKGKDFLLKDGDILFARSGATVGKTYQFRKSMSIENYYCYAGYLIKAEVNENIILSDYLYLYTNSGSFNQWKESIFIKATIENIGADKYSQLEIPLPPLQEQEEIVNYLDTQTAKIDKAITLQENKISKLQEFKISLINSVVTGKVKVEEKKVWQ